MKMYMAVSRRLVLIDSRVSTPEIIRESGLDAVDVILFNYESDTVHKF